MQSTKRFSKRAIRPSQQRRQTTEDTRKRSRSSRCITGHAVERRAWLCLSLVFIGLTRVRPQLAIYLSAFIETVFRKTLREVNRDSGTKSPTLKIRKKLCVRQN